MRYVYRREDNGELVELWMTVEEMERRQGKNGFIILDDGVKAIRDYAEEHRQFTVEKPITSDGLGCHPEQCREFEEQARSLGVPVEFDRRTGQALFTGRRHRNRYIKALNSATGANYHDRDGCYSD